MLAITSLKVVFSSITSTTCCDKGTWATAAKPASSTRAIDAHFPSCWNNIKTPSPFLAQAFPAACTTQCTSCAGLPEIFLRCRNYISKTTSADYNLVKKTNNKGRLLYSFELLHEEEQDGYSDGRYGPRSSGVLNGVLELTNEVTLGEFWCVSVTVSS